MRVISVVVALVACGLVACGSGEKSRPDQESLARRAGSKVGETITQFTSGVGAGVDTTLVVPVELSRELTARGLSKTVAKARGIGSHEKGFTVYLIAKRPLSGRLMARAYDAQGLEIGRAKTQVSFGDDDAKYVTFTFESEMDANLVARYTIDLAKG